MGTKESWLCTVLVQLTATETKESLFDVLKQSLIECSLTKNIWIIEHDFSTDTLRWSDNTGTDLNEPLRTWIDSCGCKTLEPLITAIPNRTVVATELGSNAHFRYFLLLELHTPDDLHPLKPVIEPLLSSGSIRLQQLLSLEKLTHKYHFLLDVFDSMNNIGLVIDQSGCIVNINQAAIAFTGHCFEQLKNRPFVWENWTPAHERKDLRHLFAPQGASGLRFQHENHWISAHGESRLFDWFNAILYEGTVPYLVILGFDITEQEQLQHSLIQERNRFRTLLYHASDGVHILDSQQHLLEASWQFCHMLDYPYEALLRQSAELWSTEPFLLPATELSGDPNTNPYRYTTSFRRRNGTTIPVEVTQVPMLLEGQTVYFNSARDISKRRSIELSLVNSQQQAEQLARFTILLAHINRLITTSPSESELLQSVCDLSIEHLNLSLAWVATPDTEGHFIRLAACGAVDFIAHQQACTHITHIHGNGTLGPAWRQSQLIYNPSFAQHATLNILADQALRYQIRSSVSIPIFRQGQRWAIFSLYHHDENFLTQALQDILLTLSEDIGLGLDILYNKNIQHLMFNHAHAGIVLVKNRTILLANEHMCRITGLSLDEICRQLTRSLFVYEDEWQQVGVAYSKFQQQTVITIPAISVTSKNSDPVIADFSGVKLEGYDDLTVWTIEDVTIRVAQEQQLQTQATVQTLLGHIQSLFANPDADENQFLKNIQLTLENSGCTAVGLYRDGIISDSRFNISTTVLEQAVYSKKTVHLAACSTDTTPCPLSLLPLLQQNSVWVILILTYATTPFSQTLWENGLTTLNQAINLGLERYWAQKEERRTFALNQILLDSQMAGIMVTRHPGGIVEHINAQMLHLLHLENAQGIVGHSGQHFLANAENIEKVNTLIQQIIRRNNGLLRDLYLIRHDGSAVYTDIAGQLLPSTQTETNVVRILWTLFDVSERHEYVQKISTLNQTLFDLLNNTTAGINLVRYPDRIIIEANQAFLDIMGRTRSEIIGLPTNLFYPNSTENERMFNLSARILTQGHGQLRNLNILRKDGTSVFIDISGQKIDWKKSEQTTENVVVWTSVDVTERHRLSNELALQALYDPLTHLPNRRALEREFGKMMARAKRYDWLLAVVMLDLDGFKPVNDHYGHETGDEVLKIISQRLAQTIRTTDFVARLGGDEFVLLIEDCQTMEDIGHILDKVNQSICQPIQTEAAPVLHLSASAGLCIYPLTTTDNPEVLLRLADQALYENKAHKSDRACFWTLYGQKTVLQYNEVQQWLHAGRVQIHYQVIYSNHSEKIIGIEALARLIDNQELMVLPARFLSLLTVNDLFLLSQKVLQQALADLAHIDHVYPGLWLSINIDPRNLDSRCFSSLSEHLSNSTIPAERIYLEIAHGENLENSADTINLLHQLKTLGIKLVLDDIGSAYASLLQIKELPVDAIKLDQSFVCTLHRNTNDLYFIKSILELAHGLGIVLIVEGVETREIMDMVQSLGAPVMQGFAIAHPLPLNELLHFLQKPNLRINENPTSLLGIYAKQLTHHNAIKKIINLNPELIDSSKLGNPLICPIHQDLLYLHIPDNHPVFDWHDCYHQALQCEAQRVAHQKHHMTNWQELNQINHQFQNALLELWKNPTVT